MKTLLLLLVVAVLCGCSTDNPTNNVDSKTDQVRAALVGTWTFTMSDHRVNGEPTLEEPSTSETVITALPDGRVVIDGDTNDIVAPFETYAFRVWRYGKITGFTHKYSLLGNMPTPTTVTGTRIDTVLSDVYTTKFDGVKKQ